MAGPLPIRKGVDRKSKTVLDPHEAFDAGEVVTEVEITTPPTAGTATVVQSGTRVRYVAPDVFVRNATFSWRMRVGGNWTLPAVVTLRVGRLPKRPGQRFPIRPLDEVAITRPAIVAAADTVTTDYRTPVTIDVLDNDTGVELSVVSASEPAQGTTVVNDDDTITYTPADDFSGQDAFSYVITDGPQMAVGIVTVTVDSPDIAAEPDFATAIGNAPVLISPLTNDIGTGLTVTAVGTPEHGTAAIADAGQRITYQAALGYTGVDSFSYTITDGSARTSVATVQVEVLPPMIVAVPDEATTATTAPVVISVLANDVGVGLTLTEVAVTPADGSAVISGGGTTITYTANPAFTGQDRFSYLITDAYGQTAFAEVVVNVEAVASTILAVNDSVTAVAGVTQTISPLGNDIGSSLSISAVGAPSAGGQAIRTNGNSQILYTPAIGYAGTETFTYTITNGSQSSTGTIAAEVTIPTFALADDQINTRAGVAVTFSPLANDTGSGLRIARIGGACRASCRVINDDSAVGPPPGHDLFLIPFNKDAACHRPVGAGAAVGIPGGTLNETTYDPDVTDTTAVNNAMARIGRITFSTGAATFKYQHRVAATDGVRTVGWRGLRADSSGTGEGFEPNGQSLVEVRMPAPGVVRDSGTIAYPPTAVTTTPEAGDNSVFVYPEDGNPNSTIGIFLNQLRYNMPDGTIPKAADGQNAEARFIRKSDLRGTDISDSGNGRGSGASELIPPGTYLRWHEISDPNHGPINHPLNLTGTRQNANKNNPSLPQVQPSAHLLGKKRVWPAKNTDSDSDAADNNLGPFPYGVRFYIPATTGNKALRNDTTLCQNNRHQRLFDCIMYQGMYLLDGHGQSAPGDTSKGEIRIRIDNQIPSAVQTDLQGFLDRLLARNVIKPMRNPRRYNSETERHTNGLCYAGGGGPIDANSINNAYDAGSATGGGPTPIKSIRMREIEPIWAQDIVRHQTNRSGRNITSSFSTSYGQFGDVDFGVVLDEAWLDFLITFAPAEFPTFDIDTKRTGCLLVGDGRSRTGTFQSGKIPGIGMSGSGTGGTTPREDGKWSARCHFEPWNSPRGSNGDVPLADRGKIRVSTYDYDQTRTGTQGGRKRYFTKADGTEPFLLKGVTYRWTQRVKINDPDVFNGENEIWIDGQRVFLKADVKWRGPVGATVARVSGFKPHSYYGGGDCDSPTFDSFVKFGRFRVYDQPPNFSVPPPD
jgi:hypothetical protein